MHFLELLEYLIGAYNCTSKLNLLSLMPSFGSPTIHMLLGDRGIFITISLLSELNLLIPYYVLKKNISYYFYCLIAKTEKLFMHYKCQVIN